MPLKPTSTANATARPSHRCVLVIQPAGAGRSIAAESLAGNGVRVIEHSRAERVADQALAVNADLLVLDVDTTGLDAVAAIRILRRHPGTRDLPVMLACLPTVNRERLREIASMGVQGVLLKPVAAETFLQKAMATLNAKPVQNGDKADKSASPFEARHVESNSSILVRGVLCPFHDEECIINLYTLRAGKVETDVDFFDITVYKAAAKGGDFINHHLLAVMVCPICHFASNHSGYFVMPNDRRAARTEFVKGLIDRMNASTPERKAIAKGTRETFFNEQRTPMEAVISYHLALQASRTMLAFDAGGFSHEILRAANYHLRLAQLHADPALQLPPPNGFDHHREALDLLKQAFSVLDGANLARATYQLVAAAIHLGEDKDARAHMERLKAMEAEGGLSPEDQGVYQRYLARCQEAWTDREMHRRNT